jgi:hypothetical protein
MTFFLYCVTITLAVTMVLRTAWGNTNVEKRAMRSLKAALAQENGFGPRPRRIPLVTFGR